MIACKETSIYYSPPPQKKQRKNNDDWNPNPQIFFRYPLRTEIHFFVGTFKFLSEGSKFCQLLGKKKDSHFKNW